MTVEEYFTTHSSDLVYAAIVIGVWLALFALTNPLLRWVMRKKRKRFGGEMLTTLNLVKMLLNALWSILGVIALSYIFVHEDRHGALNDNFKLALYLGVVTVLTIVAGTTLNVWFKRAIKHRILTNEDPTNFKFLRYIAVSGVYIIGGLFGLLAIPSLHGVAQTALGGAGVIAIIVGVSSQEALSNLIGGMFIIAFKPFKVGDVVAIDNTIEGTVTDITLRHTVIRTWKNRMIVIPNSIINKEKLVNYDMGEEKCCEYVEMNISYDSDVDLAKEILREECESHPLILDNRTEEE